MATTTRTLEEISDLKGQLEKTKATQARKSSYKTLNDYLGREYVESERFGIYASKQDRERFSFESETDDEKDLTVNITKTHLIIQDQVSFLGSPHSIRFPAIDAASQAYCDKLEQACVYLDRKWNMGRRKQEIATYSVSYGTGVGVLQFSKTERLPLFRSYSPENLLVQPSVDDDTSPQVAIFVVETIGRALMAAYPNEAKNLNMDAEYDLVDFYDGNERVRFVDGENIELLRVKNPLGRVPVYLFPGILMPNSCWGSSPLLRAIPAENEIQRLNSMQALHLRDVVEAPMVIKDPINVPENARWNRDCSIEVGAQGGVGRASIASMDAQMLIERIRSMEENLNQMMDFSPIMQGQAVGSYLTGKGVTSLQQPIMQRLASKLQPSNAVYAQVYIDALTLWNKLGSKGGKRISGAKSGQLGPLSFATMFDPKVDIDPENLDCIVSLDTASFVDRSSAKIAAIQEVRGTPPLSSVRRYLEMNPDVDNVESEIAQMKTEFQEWETMRTQIQMQAQQQMMAMQQPQQAVGPDGQPIPGQPPAAGAPAQPGMEPPPGEPPAEPLPGESPEGAEDILGAVAEAFRGVGKVRGQVFLVGEILLDGLTVDEVAEGMIEVVVTEPIDKATILNGIRQTPMAVYADQGKFAFHEDPAMLERQPYLEVTPGTSGTEITEPGGPAPEDMDVGPGVPGEESMAPPPAEMGTPAPEDLAAAGMMV